MSAVKNIRSDFAGPTDSYLACTDTSCRLTDDEFAAVQRRFVSVFCFEEGRGSAEEAACDAQVAGDAGLSQA